MELKHNPQEPFDHDAYQKAKQQVADIRGFYIHFFVYLLVNLFFLVVNLRYSPHHIWFFWPAFGWGIGVLFHGLRVFSFSSSWGKSWEERKIREFMEKEKQQQQKQH
ncbi:2TM domain-containing protein [Flavobacterium fontis]|uniref:2TM domain-containing protein n=1 Tax=Flavobacterium fontis TaxID=1124188 RepID=A0A1M5ERV3_9FLAO|nr:2TM domain-containing protein [Flavobacterium fontis]SHF81742.1 2TM domain-containing protein [Flavobacterium fontis]